MVLIDEEVRGGEEREAKKRHVISVDALKAIYQDFAERSISVGDEALGVDGVIRYHELVIRNANLRPGEMVMVMSPRYLNRKIVRSILYLFPRVRNRTYASSDLKTIPQKLIPVDRSGYALVYPITLRNFWRIS